MLGPPGEDPRTPFVKLWWLAPSPVPRLWTLPYGVSVIPSPRPAAWSAVRQHDRRVNQRGRPRQRGVMTITTRADRETSVITPRQLAWRGVGRGDHVTHRRPSRPAPARQQRCRCCGRGGPRHGPVRRQPGPLLSPLDCFYRGPADQPAALLGDPAPVHGGVGLVVLRRQPRPRRQLGGSIEPVHVTDLGDEHRPQDRARLRESS